MKSYVFFCQCSFYYNPKDLNLGWPCGAKGSRKPRNPETPTMPFLSVCGNGWMSFKARCHYAGEAQCTAGKISTKYYKYRQSPNFSSFYRFSVGLNISVHKKHYLKKNGQNHPRRCLQALITNKGFSTQDLIDLIIDLIDLSKWPILFPCVMSVY